MKKGGERVLKPRKERKGKEGKTREGERRRRRRRRRNGSRDRGRENGRVPECVHAASCGQAVQPRGTKGNVGSVCIRA